MPRSVPRAPRAPRLAARFVLLVLLVLTLAALAIPARLSAGSPHRATPEKNSPPTRTSSASVWLTHNGNGSASVYTNSTGSTTFTVHNDGYEALTVLLSVTTCSSTGKITNCSASPAGGYVGAGSTMPVTVSYTAGPATASSETVTLRVVKAADYSWLAETSVSVSVVVDPNAPVVSTSPHRGDVRDVSQCIADCFESTLSYTTPAYISLGVPRTVTLLYRSGRARPMGRLALDVTDPTTTATSFRLQLTDPNGSFQTFSNGTTSLFFARNTAAGQPTRLVAEFDAASIPTSAKLYTAYVTSYTGGTQGVTNAVAVRIIVINDKDSPFGAGIDLVELQRIFTNQAGGVLLTEGSGSGSFFSGFCTPTSSCTFTSSTGDFSTLATGSNQYKRTYPDGTVVTFDAAGRQLSTKSRFGDSTYVQWGTTINGVSVPVLLFDPAGVGVQFWWRGPGEGYGTFKDGTLGNIHTGTGADIPLGVTPANNMWHWVETGGGTYRYRTTYDTLHRLTGVQLKNDSVWTYAYRYGATVDSTVAPSVKLADNSTAKPRVLLRNAADALLRGAAGGGGTSGAPLAVPSDFRASITDPAGNVTYYSLSKFGAPTKTKAPLIPADSNEYDASTGQVLRTISLTGHDVRYTYDSVHRLQTVNDVTLGKVDSIWYKSQYWLPDAIKSTDGQQWFWYDSLKTGWPLTKTAPTGGGPFTLHYADALGRDTAVVDPATHRTSYTYASTGLRNLQSVRGPTELPTTYVQDAAGRDTMVTDPYGNVRKQQFDVLNRPTLSVGPQADTTRFYYNLMNVDTAIVDAKGQTFKVLPNALGWVTTRVTPGSGTDSIFYDIAGRVARTVSRAGRQVQFAYDSLSRLVKRTGVATQSIDSTWYDPNGKWVTVQSRIGTTVLSTDTDSTNEAAHTATSKTSRASIGNWRVQSYFNSTDPGVSSLYLYKQVNGSDSTVTFTNYRYQDTYRRLTAMESQSDTANFFYNGESLVDSVSLQTGISEKFTYTPTHELSTRNYTGVSSVDDVLRRWYRTDSLARIAERGGPDTTFQAFGYDAVSRLNSWQKKAKHSGVQCVNNNTNDGYGYTCTDASPWILGAAVTPSYDLVGNPNDAGTVVATGNRLTSFNGVTLTYSADGDIRTRVTSTTTDTLDWDEFGRLWAVKRVVSGQPAVTTTFTYDGFGRRITKTTGANTVQYVWNGNQIAAELDGSGNVKKTYNYYPGVDKPRSVTSGGQTYFFSLEPDGTVDGVIRKSDRAVVAQYAHTPWGELESSAQTFDSVSTLRWKGLPYDAETGFYYMRARYYDPKIRRFMLEDPISLDGGLNVYAFASGDPVNRSDPSGLDDYFNTGTIICIVRGTRTYTGGELTSETVESTICLPPAPPVIPPTDQGPSLPIPDGQGPPPGNPGTRPPGGGDGPGVPKPVHGIPNYGNWCGVGGEGAPIDATDAACMAHDRCYDRHGLSALSNFTGSHNVLKACNQLLCNSVRARAAELRLQAYNMVQSPVPFLRPFPQYVQREYVVAAEINAYFTYAIAIGGSSCHSQ